MQMQPLRIPCLNNPLTNPAAWNARWEDLLRSMNSMPSDPAFPLSFQLLQNYIGDFKLRYGPNATTDWQEVYELHRSTRLLQLDVGSYRQIVLDNLSFEQRWMDASEQTRKEHALKGLSEACGIAYNLHEARVFCKDVLTLDHLCQDGRVLLNLMKDITPNDLNTMPQEPYYIPDAEWDGLRRKSDSFLEIEKIIL